MPRKHGANYRAIRVPHDGADGQRIVFRLNGDPGTDFFASPGDGEKNTLVFDSDSLIQAFDRGLVVLKSGPSDVLETLRSFQFYQPFIDGLPAAEHDPELLAALGQAMAGQGDAEAETDSTIPAAYTYFGQFIAHDISRLTPRQLADGPYSTTTPALDLDSVFGDLDVCKPVLAASAETEGTLPLGNTSSPAKDLRDLPRSPCGEAQIGDARNDQNLAVAQMHVMITQFYWRMLERFEGESETDQREAAKRATIRHFQHVVLHDYLKRLIDPCTYCDVMQNGPRFVGSAPFLIPTEFAVACFRVGHSMVRTNYRNWSGTLGANISDLLAHTYRQQDMRLKRVNYSGVTEYRLRGNWPILWSSFTSEPDFMSGGYNLASKLNEQLTSELRGLDHYLVDEVLSADSLLQLEGKPSDQSLTKTFDLSVQTLLRGIREGLPSAQEFYQALQAKLSCTSGALPKPLSAHDIANVNSPSLRAFLKTGAGQELTKSTPLWFYCLRESAESKFQGSRFGPLTSRVVMESIYNAIAADPHGILNDPFGENEEVKFSCLKEKKTAFKLADFIDFATNTKK